MEPLKNVTARESDYNTMTLIAKQNGFLYPEGHAQAGKMIPSLVIEHLIKNFKEPIA